MITLKCYVRCIISDLPYFYLNLLYTAFHFTNATEIRLKANVFQKCWMISEQFPPVKKKSSFGWNRKTSTKAEIEFRLAKKKKPHHLPKNITFFLSIAIVKFEYFIIPTIWTFIIHFFITKDSKGYQQQRWKQF